MTTKQSTTNSDFDRLLAEGRKNGYIRRADLEAAFQGSSGKARGDQPRDDGERDDDRAPEIEELSDLDAAVDQLLAEDVDIVDDDEEEDRVRQDEAIESGIQAMETDSAPLVDLPDESHAGAARLRRVQEVAKAAERGEAAEVDAITAYLRADGAQVYHLAQPAPSIREGPEVTAMTEKARRQDGNDERKGLPAEMSHELAPERDTQRDLTGATTRDETEDTSAGQPAGTAEPARARRAPRKASAAQARAAEASTEASAEASNEASAEAPVEASAEATDVTALSAIEADRIELEAQGFTAEEADRLIEVSKRLETSAEARASQAELKRLRFAQWLIERGILDEFSV